MQVSGVQAGIYCRISSDTEGEGLGVQRQESMCRDLAKAKGWTVHKVYVDNDISASTGKHRPQYEAMLADAEAGAINGIVSYDIDRLTRQPIELERIITLSEKHKVALGTCRGEIDLSTDGGQLMARILGAFARKEAQNISARVKAQKQQAAESGKPAGGRFRTFGYTRDFKVIPEEAAVVKEIFSRSASGESWHNIFKDLNSRGIKTTSGGEFRRSTIVRIIERKEYAGIRVHKGKEVGSTSYESIITPAEWEAGQRKATINYGYKHNARKYPLSGYVVCGECLTNMHSNGRQYLCKTDNGGCGTVSMTRRYLEEAFLTAVMKKAEHDTTTGAVIDNTKAIAKIDAEITAVRQQYDAGELDLMDVTPMLKGLRAKRAVLKDEEAASVIEHRSPVDAVIEDAVEYLSAGVEPQRAYVGKYLSSITITKHTGPRNVVDLQRITFHWKDGSASKPKAGGITLRMSKSYKVQF